MKKHYCLILFTLLALPALAQKTYLDSISRYQKYYIASHEVVKGNDKKFFRFFAPDESFRFHCRFEKSMDSSIVRMATSGKTIPEKNFTCYGNIIFTLHDTACQLKVYRSLSSKPAYNNYLFIPFTDLTSGDETYGSGRYIDIVTTDIINNSVEIDFNKAYNPYCAYTTGYNCPIPPRQNYLPVAIKAGEKTFAKPPAH